MGKTNIFKYWDIGQLNLGSTSKVYEVNRLRGGDSIVIKALAGNQGLVYIGDDRLLAADNGFELSADHTLHLALPASFGRDNEVIIYAIAASANDDLCYAKLIGDVPVASAAVK